MISLSSQLLIAQNNIFSDDILITPSVLKKVYNDDQVIALESRLIEVRDSNEKVEILIELGDIYCNRVNYQKAYTTYWSALALLDQNDNEILRASVYNGMGILYSLYNRNQQALKYYKKSLSINRRLDDTLAQGRLRANYFTIAVHYRYEENLTRAKIYLDSCVHIQKRQNYDGFYAEAEAAYHLMLEHQLDKAYKKFMVLHKELDKGINEPYKVVFYSLYGELFYKLKEYDLAISMYHKSIKYAFETKSHINFVPDTYRSLSDVYLTIGEHKKAYIHLDAASRLEEYLYSSKSLTNQFLLEINDTYKKREQEQQHVIALQEIQRIKQDKQILCLYISLLILFTLFIIVIIASRIKSLKKNHKLERVAMHERQELEKEQQNKILTIRNQELTQSTLQSIAKDEVLASVKEKLKVLQKQHNSKELKSVINTIKVNQDMSWLDFEHRFTNANKEFFENLKTKFPQLSNYDLKVCALVKLNFSAKEMAKLLGISPESATTSRYRLRKKLGIQKGIDLTNFINSI